MNPDIIMAIAATASAIAALLAVVVAVISFVYTKKSLKKQEEYQKISVEKQEEHNRNSVRPICEIRCTDYEDKISVYLYNVGTGPLEITEIICANIVTDVTSPKLIDLLPNVNQPWSTFTGNVKGRAISAGKNIYLIEINPMNEDIKHQLRRALSDIKIIVKYSDVYDTPFVREKRLSFFGRHFRDGDLSTQKIDN